MIFLAANIDVCHSLQAPMQAYADLLTQRTLQREQLRAAERVRVGGSGAAASPGASDSSDAELPRRRAPPAAEAKLAKQQRKAVAGGRSAKQVSA